MLCPGTVPGRDGTSRGVRGPVLAMSRDRAVAPVTALIILPRQAPDRAGRTSHTSGNGNATRQLAGGVSWSFLAFPLPAERVRRSGLLVAVFGVVLVLG